MADQEALSHSSTSPSSAASSTDLENIQGPLTVAEFIQEIEAVTGSIVVTLSTGRKNLYVYSRHAQRPLVNVDQLLSAGVAQREANSLEEAQARTAANAAVGRRRISPKKAERHNSTIYFTALCEDNQEYTISWSP
ncbi:unnamed protein product [Auanema sp. JU1783]|nr:unnamed protein product [Auanema sp. JU1783]